MWQLTELKAKNICSFEEFDYRPTQNQATLIFGNNLDSESQNSNGSGKSALIEALAIGLLGEPLRKINADEIINDRFDEAETLVVLINIELHARMSVTRKFSRKKPQEIEVDLEQNGMRSTIKEASVLDYNRLILDKIGLTKDDILHNFILTARKYQSFLSSSDKDKKEIINRFSNGVMIDESIEALHTDMEPLQRSLAEAESEVSKCVGRVSALAEEIEHAINDAEENKSFRKSRISSINDIIATKRNAIRDWNEKKRHIDARLDQLDLLYAEMQNLEDSDSDTLAAFEIIVIRFAKIGLNITNYIDKIQNSHVELDEVTREIQQLDSKFDKLTKVVADLVKKAQEISEENESEFQHIDKQCNKLENEIQQLREQIRELKTQSNELVQQRSKAVQTIADLEKQLAGVIECPNCHHEFTLRNDMDVVDARIQLDTCKNQLNNIEKSIASVEDEYTKFVDDGKSKSHEQAELQNKKRPLQQAYNETLLDLANAKNKRAVLNSNIDSTNVKLRLIQETIANMRKKMFDEVFDVIDAETKQNEQNLEGVDNAIQVEQSAIAVYEEQIKQLQSETADNSLERLKKSKARYEQDLTNAETNKEQIAAQLNVLKEQEATFVEFKTYLANTKINAISQITNDFLEAIGSDIRVSLSGYTVLKSGKIRDKISVSLIRDGIDCGSFDKFSAGEKCRVELASVLALHKLSNVNCEDGKGLNLLVIDEILDCTDEVGLANVFKALNDTQVTALVVSHGNIAENYPNRLVVSKKNGVSTI